MSVNKAFSQESEGVNALNFEAHTENAQGAEVDMTGYHALTFFVTIGAWTDGTHGFGLERSDDGGNTWEAIGAEKIVGSLPEISDDSTDNSVLSFDYKGLAGRVRVATSVSGASTGAVYGVTAVKHAPSYSHEHPLAN